MASRKPKRSTSEKPSKRPRSRPGAGFLSTNSGPSPTPIDKVEAVDRILQKAGIKKPRSIDNIDKEYTSGKGNWNEKALPTVYKTLDSILGRRVLEGLEKGMLGTMCILISVFLGVGVAVSYQAFLKASNKPVPEALDHFLTNNFEQTFTPSLLVFLGLSVVYGLYKQSQLRSGATNYDER